MSSPADTLLSRLDGVRQVRPGAWMARCCAHEDRSPSLSVRELDDGRVLVHCFAGCDAGEVLAAVGLELADLFPKRPDDHRRKPVAARDRFHARDLLRQLVVEATIVAIAADEIVRTRHLNDDERERLRTAHTRIVEIASLAA